MNPSQNLHVRHSVRKAQCGTDHEYIVSGHSSRLRSVIAILLSSKCFCPVEGLTAKFATAADGVVHSKPLLLPVQVPSLVQDPQNVPRSDLRYFGFERGGTLGVDLQILPVHTTLKRRALDYPHLSHADSIPGGDTSEVYDIDEANPINLVGAVFRTPEKESVDSHQEYANLADGHQFNVNAPRPSQQQRSAPQAYMWRRTATAAWKGVSAFCRLVVQGPFRSVWSSAKVPAAMLPLIQVAPDPSEQRKNPKLRVLQHTDETTTPLRDLYLFLLNQDQWEAFVITITNAANEDGFLADPSEFTSYLRAEVRVPIEQNVVRFTHHIARPGNYLLLLLNGAEIPLQLFGQITMVNPSPLLHLTTAARFNGRAVAAMFSLNFAAFIVMLFLAYGVWKHRKSDLHNLMINMTFRTVIATKQILHFLQLNFALKISYLALDWFNVRAFTERGELDPVSWVVPRMLAKLQDIIVLLLFLLIAAGWKISRSRLTTVETRALAAVSMLSLYLGIFEVSMGAFEALRYVVHSLAYLVIIVSINFEIAFIGTAITEMGLSRATAETYHKWQGFRIFRVIFMIFVLKPTAILFFKLTLLGDSDLDDWLIVVADNVLDLGIIGAVVYAFRPPSNFKLFEVLGLSDYDTSEPQRSLMQLAS